MEEKTVINLPSPERVEDILPFLTHARYKISSFPTNKKTLVKISIPEGLRGNGQEDFVYLNGKLVEYSDNNPSCNLDPEEL